MRRVLLLDEPLSNLGANLREGMRFEIRRLRVTVHFTMVCVTHDQAEAMASLDRLAVRSGGRIERADALCVLDTRARTRVVAGFISRTKLVSTRCDGVRVAFDRFSLRRRLFEGEGSPPAVETLFSITPGCPSSRNSGASEQTASALRPHADRLIFASRRPELALATSREDPS